MYIIGTKKFHNEYVNWFIRTNSLNGSIGTCLVIFLYAVEIVAKKNLSCLITANFVCQLKQSYHLNTDIIFCFCIMIPNATVSLVIRKLQRLSFIIQIYRLICWIHKIVKKCHLFSFATHQMTELQSYSSVYFVWLETAHRWQQSKAKCKNLWEAILCLLNLCLYKILILKIHIVRCGSTWGINSLGPGRYSCNFK